MTFLEAAQNTLCGGQAICMYSRAQHQCIQNTMICEYGAQLWNVHSKILYPAGREMGCVGTVISENNKNICHSNTSPTEESILVASAVESIQR